MVGCFDGIAVGSQEGSSVTYTADQVLFNNAESIASVDMATHPSSSEVSLT